MYRHMGLTGTLVKERLVLGDSLLPQSYVLNSAEVPEACYHNSVAASPDRILLLASQGVPLFCPIPVCHVSFPSQLADSLVCGFGHASP